MRQKIGQIFPQKSFPHKNIVVSASTSKWITKIEVSFGLEKIRYSTRGSVENLEGVSYPSIFHSRHQFATPTKHNFPYSTCNGSITSKIKGTERDQILLHPRGFNSRIPPTPHPLSCLPTVQSLHLRFDSSVLRQTSKLLSNASPCTTQEAGKGDGSRTVIQTNIKYNQQNEGKRPVSKWQA